MGERCGSAKVGLIFALLILTSFCCAGDYDLAPQFSIDPSATQQDQDAAEAVVTGADGTVAPRTGIPNSAELETLGVVAPPAWAAQPIAPSMATTLLPFGSNLFTGNFTSTRPDALGANYIITAGDQVALRIWGSRNDSTVLTVDYMGNIFIPEIGPVKVGGLRHSRLSGTVEKAIQAVFPRGVNVYTVLLSPQPLSVYVSGFVTKPGRYAGGAADSLLSFIDRAGGIISERGSYRSIRIIRGGTEAAKIDLYEFIRDGILPNVALMDDDVILVEERGPSVAVMGQLRQQARYEFPPDQSRAQGVPSFSGYFPGLELMEIASPLAGVSHVTVSGIREGRPFSAYLSREEFSSFMLMDNDVVEFLSDLTSRDIMVSVTGAILDDAKFSLRKGATLRELLSHVSVDPATADLSAIYLRRRGVALQQKRAISDALDRLEMSAGTATSASPAEAQVRLGEAQLVNEFVKRARQVEPDGVVVVTHQGQVVDILLEDGDIVVVPQRSHVVQTSGEVLMPKVMAFRNGLTVDNYIAESGGFTRRADKRNVLIVRPNGEVVPARKAVVCPGDHIITLTRYESKNLLLIKDLTQILYQIAVATKVAVDL